jgi:hypothetical protein
MDPKQAYALEHYDAFRHFDLPPGVVVYVPTEDVVVLPDAGAVENELCRQADELVAAGVPLDRLRIVRAPVVRRWQRPEPSDIFSDWCADCRDALGRRRLGWDTGLGCACRGHSGGRHVWPWPERKHGAIRTLVRQWRAPPPPPPDPNALTGYCDAPPSSGGQHRAYHLWYQANHKPSAITSAFRGRRYSRSSHRSSTAIAPMTETDSGVREAEEAREKATRQRHTFLVIVIGVSMFLFWDPPLWLFAGAWALLCWDDHD